MHRWQFLAFSIFLGAVLFSAAFQRLYAEDGESISDTAPLTLIWQTAFSADAALISPSDLVVDADGYIYVSVQGNVHIKKFDNQGNFVLGWGSNGSGAGEFRLSSGIAVDSANNIYVVDFTTLRIQVFDSSGNFIRQWNTASPMGPASIGVDQQGYVYVDNFTRHNQYIQRFDNEGNLINEWGDHGSEPGQFIGRGTTGPEDLAIDLEGHIYVVDRVNQRIQKFDPEGNTLAVFGGESSSSGNVVLSNPIGLSIDSQGNMYVLDDYFLQKLDPDGNVIARWSNAEGTALDGARLVSVDAHGDLYVIARVTATAANGDSVSVFVIKKFAQA